MNELTHLRTARSKTYDVGGGKRRVEITMHRQHYHDGTEWRDIETDWQFEDGFGHKIQKADYRARRHGNKMRFGFAPGVFVDYTVPVELSFDGSTASGSLSENAVIKYVGTPDGLKMDIVLSACPVLAPSYAFTVETTNCSASADGNSLLFRDAAGEIVGAIPSPFMTDASGEMGSVALLWDGYRVIIEPDAAWLESATYPVTIDPTTTLQVNAGGDDGWIFSDFFSSTPSTVSIGVAGNSRSPYARFTNIAIPNSATITSAYIQYRSSETLSTASVITRIYASNEDNAVAPTSREDYDGRPLTTAYVDWTIPAWAGSTWYDSPDIKTVIQQVVNRAGWASGNAILLFHKDNGSTAYRQLYQYESGSANAPKLTIEYSAGGTDGTVAAVAATATADAISPAVAGHQSPDVSAVCATATAQAIAPSVSGTEAIDATVNAVCATATAAAIAPSVTAQISALVGPPAAHAAAAALPPSATTRKLIYYIIKYA